MFKSVTKQRQDGRKVTYTSHIPIKWPLLIGLFFLWCAWWPAKEHDWPVAIMFGVIAALPLAYAFCAIIKDLGIKKWP